MLTRDNIRLVDPSDAQRWSDACGAYEAVFELADQLVGSDHNNDSLLDTRTEASGIALDELVASVDDGAMKAWRHLVDRIEQHPAAPQMFEGMDVAAFSDLWCEADGETETAALEAARRLAVARFDAPVVETLEGVVRQAGGLPTATSSCTSTHLTAASDLPCGHCCSLVSALPPAIRTDLAPAAAPRASPRRMGAARRLVLGAAFHTAPRFCDHSRRKAPRRRGPSH